MFLKTYVVTAKTNPDIFYELEAPSKRIAKWMGAAIASHEYGTTRRAKDMIAEEVG